jgi:hypothetical protein
MISTYTKKIQNLKKEKFLTKKIEKTNNFSLEIIL